MNDLLTQIGLDLNDIDQSGAHTTWTEDKLVADVSDALALIAASMPYSVNTEEITIKLVPCSITQDVTDGRRILSVIGQCDRHGRIINYLPKGGASDFGAWPKRCSNKSGRQLSSYSITAGGTLSVFPAPVAGADTYLRVIVAKKFSKGDSVPASLRPAVKEWVLYKCLQVDNDGTEVASSVAAGHYKRFFDIIQYLTVAKENSDRE